MRIQEFFLSPFGCCSSNSKDPILFSVLQMVKMWFSHLCSLNYQNTPFISVHTTDFVLLWHGNIKPTKEDILPFLIFFTYNLFIEHVHILSDNNEQHTKVRKNISFQTITFLWLPVLRRRIVSKSKVGNHSQGWPEGSLFNSYYTKVKEKALQLSLDCSTLPLIHTL